MRHIRRAISHVPWPIGKSLVRKFYHDPIFIVGTNRAGKSLLTRALGHHPAVFTPFSASEAPLVAIIGGLAETIDSCGKDVPADSVISDPRSYLQRSVRVPVGDVYESLRRLCFESVAGPRYGIESLARHIFRNRSLSIVSRGRRWCSEAYPTESAYRGLLTLYPRATFIYIVRHAASAVQARIDAVRAKTERQIEFAIPCRKWAEGAAKYDYLTRADAAMTVRFEDMAADPVRFFNNLYSFVGLDAHDAPAQFVESILGATRSSRTPAGTKVGNEDALPTSTWSADEWREFLDTCGPGMQKLGYPLPPG